MCAPRIHKNLTHPIWGANIVPNSEPVTTLVCLRQTRMTVAFETFALVQIMGQI